MFFYCLVVEKKTKSMAYFSAGKNKTYNPINSIIPMDWIKNMGAGVGMNYNGIFTVPTDGIYMFTFSGITTVAGTRVQLRVNDNSYGTAWAEGKAGTYALQAVIALNAGSTVCMWLEEGSVGDYNKWNTHFTGVQLAFL